MRKLSLTVVLSVLGIGCNAFGQTYYRWVDADGNVTYSATPAADAKQVEPVEVQPGPSEEEVQRALERQRRFEAQLEEAEEKREQADEERKEKIEAAEEAVDKAERDLLEARKSRGRDYLSGGTLAAYRDRVQAAEEALEKAKEDLREVRSARR
jgi:hypothetical protein